MAWFDGNENLFVASNCAGLVMSLSCNSKWAITTLYFDKVAKIFDVKTVSQMDEFTDGQTNEHTD